MIIAIVYGVLGLMCFAAAVCKCTLLRRCCVCKRWMRPRYADNGWMQVSDTYCKRCFDAATAEAKARQEKLRG